MKMTRYRNNLQHNCILIKYDHHYVALDICYNAGLKHKARYKSVNLTKPGQCSAIINVPYN